VCRFQSFFPCVPGCCFREDYIITTFFMNMRVRLPLFVNILPSSILSFSDASLVFGPVNPSKMQTFPNFFLFYSIPPPLHICLKCSGPPIRQWSLRGLYWLHISFDHMLFNLSTTALAHVCYSPVCIICKIFSFPPLRHVPRDEQIIPCGRTGNCNQPATVGEGP